jgi:hypothetical protein
VIIYGVRGADPRNTVVPCESLQDAKLMRMFNEVIVESDDDGRTWGPADLSDDPTIEELESAHQVAMADKDREIQRLHDEIARGASAAKFALETEVEARSKVEATLADEVTAHQKTSMELFSAQISKIANMFDAEAHLEILGRIEKHIKEVHTRVEGQEAYITSLRNRIDEEAGEFLRARWVCPADERTARGLYTGIAALTMGHRRPTRMKPL